MFCAVYICVRINLFIMTKVWVYLFCVQFNILKIIYLWKYSVRGGVYIFKMVIANQIVRVFKARLFKV